MVCVTITGVVQSFPLNGHGHGHGHGGKRSALPVICPLLPCWEWRGLQPPEAPGGHEGTLCFAGWRGLINQLAVGEGGGGCWCWC